MASSDTYSRRITTASNLATRYGGIDGAHHKQWLIDQMLRAALGPSGYLDWRKEYDADPEFTDWDEGIAP